MRFINSQKLRFIIGGVTTTLLSYAVYRGLLLGISYPVAYTLSFAAGIMIAYLVNSLFVFRVTLAWRKAVQYPVAYLVQYGLGLALLHIQIDYAGIDARLAPLINLIILIPLTYALNHWVLTRSHPHA